MQTDLKTGRLQLCLAALFIIGNTIINMPFGNKNGNCLINFIFSAIISFVFLLIIIPLLQNTLKTKKILFFVLSALIIIFSGYFGFKSLETYVNFVGKTTLPYTPDWIIALLFLLLSAWLSAQRREVILKLSLLSFIAVSVCVIVLFLLSFSQFDFKNIIPNGFSKISDLKTGIAPFLTNTFVPIFVLTAYLTLTAEKPFKRSLITGYWLGIIILIICLLNVFLIFGERFASSLEFPYSYAISTITVGQLFSRMEGLSYPIYFTCCIIKLSVCIMTIKLIISRIFCKFQKEIPFIISGLMFAGYLLGI